MSSSSANASPSSTSSTEALSPSLPAANNKLGVKLPPNYRQLWAAEQAKFLVEKVCYPLYERDDEKPRSQRVWTLNYISSLLGYEGTHGREDVAAVLQGRARDIASRVASLEKALFEMQLIEADSTSQSSTSTSASSAGAKNKRAVKLHPNYEQFPAVEQAKFLIEKVCYPLYERDDEKPKSQRVWTLNYISSLLGYEGTHGREDVAAVLQGRADNIASRVASLEKALFEMQLIDASAVVPPLLVLDESYDKAEPKQKAKILINFCKNELGMSFNEISRPLGFPGNDGKGDIDEVLAGTANILGSRVDMLHDYLVGNRRRLATASMMKFYGSADRIRELFSWMRTSTRIPETKVFVGTGTKNFATGEIHVVCLLPADFRGTMRVGVNIALPASKGQPPMCILNDSMFAPLSARALGVSHSAFRTKDNIIDLNVLVKTLDPPRKVAQVTESLETLVDAIAHVIAPEFGWKLTPIPQPPPQQQQQQQPTRAVSRSDMSWLRKLAANRKLAISSEAVDILEKNDVTDESVLKLLARGDLDQMQLSVGAKVVLQAIVAGESKD